MILLSNNEVLFLKVHKEAHYKNGGTPIKKDKLDEEPETESEQDIKMTENENVYNDDDDYEQQEAANEIAVDEEDDVENEVDSPHDNTGVMDESLKFSMTQDSFIEDGTVARVI